MKRKIMILIGVMLLLVLIVPTAYAAVNTALTEQQQSELEQLYAQKTQIQKQILDKRVEYGQITKEQADVMKQRMELRSQYLNQNGYACPGLANGGCGGGGCGAGFGGRGFGMRGGWASQAPATNAQ